MERIFELRNGEDGGPAFVKLRRGRQRAEDGGPRAETSIFTKIKSPASLD